MPLGRIGTLCVALSCGWPTPRLSASTFPFWAAIHRECSSKAFSSHCWVCSRFSRLLPKLSYNFGSAAAAAAALGGRYLHLNCKQIIANLWFIEESPLPQLKRLPKNRRDCRSLLMLMILMMNNIRQIVHLRKIIKIVIIKPKKKYEKFM